MWRLDQLSLTVTAHRLWICGASSRNFGNVHNIKDNFYCDLENKRVDVAFLRISGKKSSDREDGQQTYRRMVRSLYVVFT